MPLSRDVQRPSRKIFRSLGPSGEYKPCETSCRETGCRLSEVLALTAQSQTCGSEGTGLAQMRLDDFSVYWNLIAFIDAEDYAPTVK